MRQALGIGWCKWRVGAACLVLFYMASIVMVWAAPFEAKLDQQGREYRNTGTITLRDPFTDAILGTYQFVTGGAGRGSAPFGRYEVGAFRGTDDDPLHIGERWMLRQVGRDDGEVWDTKLGDARTEIELHMKHPGDATHGCIGVLGGREVWREFESKIRYLVAWLGTVRFDLGEPQVMLFLHGMESRYGDTSPADVEAAARRYAEAHGYAFDVVGVSGDDVAEQERVARERIAKGDVAAVYGFSAGAITADRLQKSFPNLVYVKLGQPGTDGNIEIAGVEHMALPLALADGILPTVREHKHADSVRPRVHFAASNVRLHKRNSRVASATKGRHAWRTARATNHKSGHVRSTRAAMGRHKHKAG